MRSGECLQLCVDTYQLLGLSFLQVFEGNSDQDTVVLNSLKNPLITQFLRVQPKTWNEGIAMRTEFYGCNAGMSKIKRHFEISL